MNTKILTSAGCLLMLAAAMTPAVLGHDATNSFAGINNGVSGRYVGAAGVTVINGGGPIDVPDPTDPNAPPLFTLPSGVLTSGGLMYCDFEVLGPGNVVAPVDEINVDQVSSGGGLLPDAVAGALWVPGVSGVDDGGHGGACHTNDTYAVTGYNTAGCPADTAFANDDTFGSAVFIGASCDWEAQGSDGGVSICLVNAITHADVPGVVECVTQLVTCLANPPACAGGANDVCGGDGSSDGTTYGFGSADYPAGGQTAQFGETYNSPDDDGNSCGTGDASAGVFVFDTVTVNAGTPIVTVATAGDIWQAGGALAVTCGNSFSKTWTTAPTNPGGETVTCLGVCTTTTVTTFADKITGPNAAVVSAAVSGECVNGAVADPLNGPPGIGQAWPTLQGYFVCTLHADQGTTGTARCTQP
jgi:hypothetical protein